MVRFSLPQSFKGILVWGIAIGAASAIIGILLAFFQKWPPAETVLTTMDTAVVLLLLPWFLGSVLSQQTRASAMKVTMERTLLGGSHETMHREAAEIMSGKQWVGSYENMAAQMALVVLLLDIAVRLLLGAGWAPFPAI